MKNLIDINKETATYYSDLEKLVISAFLFGGDNYGETVVGISTDIEWMENQEGYSMVVHLEEKDGHTSTSGIGLYPKCMHGTPEKDMLTFYSSGVVFAIIPTIGMKKTLNKVHKSFDIEK